MKRKIICLLLAISFIFSLAGCGNTGISQEYLDEQIAAAREEAYQEGYDEGYDEGVKEGNENLSAKYHEGYDEGKTAGYNFGHIDGYNEGYAAGKADATASSSTTSSSSTSSSASSSSSPSSTTASAEPAAETYDYIINTSTGKFHYPWCGSVKQMKESNKWYYNGTRDSVTGMGYVACKKCNP